MTYAEGVLDANATESVTSSMFSYFGSNVTVDPSSGLEFAIEPGPLTGRSAHNDEHQTSRRIIHVERHDPFGRVGTIVTVMVLELEALKGWTRARVWIAAAMASVSALAIGLPTDVIPNPVFGRQGTPVEPWAIPVLAITAVLSGLLFATYFQDGDTVATDESGGLDRSSRFGSFGGLLSFFAVGCPICNKVVVIALGTSGALTWFAPVQPYLGVVALGLLAWALRVRLRGEVACTTVTRSPQIRR